MTKPWYACVVCGRDVQDRACGHWTGPRDTNGVPVRPLFPTYQYPNLTSSAPRVAPPGNAMRAREV